METGYRVILIATEHDEDPVYLEGITADGSAVVPGMLLEHDGSGRIQEHSVDSGIAMPVMVAHDALIFPDPTSLTSRIDQVIPANTQVFYYVPRKGDKSYMFLADGENVVRGDKLVSATGGELKKAGALDATLIERLVVGQADEDVNNSAGGAAVRIKVVH